MTERGDLRVRLMLALALFLPALFLALPAVAGGSPAEVATALAAGVAALAAIGIGVRLELTAAPVRIRAVSLRERAKLGHSIRLRDPNTPGRARPRAPSTGSLAA